MSYADEHDLTNALGTLGGRLPEWVELSTFLAVAHAEAVERLAAAYPNGIPRFTGVGFDVVRFAEAKLAAADLLDAIRVNLPELGDAPDRLRDAAYRSLDGGVAGYPAGSTSVDDDGDPDTPATSHTPGPLVSSFTALSAFPDPYEAARLDPVLDAPFSDRPIRFQ